MVMTNYRYKGQTLPKSIQKELDDHATGYTDAGLFLRACLANDMKAAVECGTYWQLELIPVITAYIHLSNHMPSGSYGDWNAIQNWSGERNDNINVA